MQVKRVHSKISKIFEILMCSVGYSSVFHVRLEEHRNVKYSIMPPLAVFLQDQFPSPQDPCRMNRQNFTSTTSTSTQNVDEDESWRIFNFHSKHSLSLYHQFFEHFKWNQQSHFLKIFGKRRRWRRRKMFIFSIDRWKICIIVWKGKWRELMFVLVLRWLEISKLWTWP